MFAAIHHLDERSSLAGGGSIRSSLGGGSVTAGSRRSSALNLTRASLTGGHIPSREPSVTTRAAGATFPYPGSTGWVGAGSMSASQPPLDLDDFAGYRPPQSPGQRQARSGPQRQQQGVELVAFPPNVLGPSPASAALPQWRQAALAGQAGPTRPLRPPALSTSGPGGGPGGGADAAELESAMSAGLRLPPGIDLV